MGKCISKTEADELFQKEHDYKEECEFWNKFNDVEFTEADIKDKELIYSYSENSTKFKVIPFSKLTEKELPNYKTIETKYMNIVGDV